MKTRLRTVATLMVMFGFLGSGLSRGVAGAGPTKTANAVPAASATFEYPEALAVDHEGGLLVAATRQHQIFRLSKSGEISLVAGSGRRGFSGDGGPAVDASLDNPGGVAVDAAGNVIIADTFNNRIRQVDARTRIISTIAGCGNGDPWKDNYPAITASLTLPTGLVVDPEGDILFTDGFRVRKVDRASGLIQAVAGRGTLRHTGDGGPATSADLVNPRALALDTGGNLFIVQAGDDRVRRVDARTGLISTIAGTDTPGFSGDGGPAANARLYGPSGVAVDREGNVFIADGSNRRIRRIDAGSGFISTVAGTGVLGLGGNGGPAESAELFGPGIVAVDSAGNLYFIELYGRCIRRIDAVTQTIAVVFGPRPGVCEPAPPQP